MLSGILGGLGGFNDRLEKGLTSPLGMMGLTLMANHGRPTTEGMFNGLPEAMLTSSQFREKVEEKKKAKDQENMTSVFLRSAGPEYASMIDSGIAPKDVWNLYMTDRKTKKDDGAELDQYGFPTSGNISQKIKAYKLQGLDDQTAFGLASGRYEVSINPQTGERVMVDAASRKLMPLEQPQYQNQAQAAPPESKGSSFLTSGDSLYDMAPDATGAWSTARRALSNTVGQVPGPIGEMANAPDQTRADQEFQLFKRDLILSLSLNERFPVSEQERIQSLIPTGPMTSAATTRTSLESLDRELARIEQQAAQWVQDPSSPVEQRQADMQTLRSVQAARQRIGLSGRSGGGNGGKTRSGVSWSIGE